MMYSLEAFTCVATEIPTKLNELRAAGLRVVCMIEIEKVQTIARTRGPASYNCAFLMEATEDPPE